MEETCLGFIESGMAKDYYKYILSKIRQYIGECDVDIHLIADKVIDAVDKNYDPNKGNIVTIINRACYTRAINWRRDQKIHLKYECGIRDIYYTERNDTKDPLDLLIEQEGDTDDNNNW